VWFHNALWTDLSSERLLRIETIDQRIASLEQEKKQYEKNASFHEKRATAWQFNKDFFLESRRERFLAEKNLDRKRLADLKIKQLKEEKGDLSLSETFLSH
jgi:hypothetical protein